MNDNEKRMATLDWNSEEYKKSIKEKLDKMFQVLCDAADQYGDTYRQGGIQMRFSDVFRKYKRLEKEYLYGLPRKREKTEDDLLDLANYVVVMWQYLDEMSQLYNGNIQQIESLNDIVIHPKIGNN